MTDMTDENFAYFSNEYAQALQAFKAIEEQSATLMVLGVSDDLRNFIDQFIEMADRTRRFTEDRGRDGFALSFAGRRDNDGACGRLGERIAQ